jgi:aminopeptidase N
LAGVPENNLTRDEARERSRTVSDLTYEIALDLRDEETFRSRTRLRFHGKRPGVTTFLDFAAAALASAELNGRPLPADALSEGRLSFPVADENELVVVADLPYEHTGVGLHRFVDPVDGAVYLHTQFEPFDAHRVFAGFDQPLLYESFLLYVF